GALRHLSQVRDQGVQDRRLATPHRAPWTPAGRTGGGSWFLGRDRPTARILGPLSRSQTRGFALSSRPVIAVDLGGTRIRAAVVLPDGTRLARIDQGTPTALGPDAIVEQCRIAARAARDGVAREVAEEIAGIGVSSPGP